MAAEALLELLHVQLDADLHGGGHLQGRGPHHLHLQQLKATQQHMLTSLAPVVSI